MSQCSDCAAAPDPHYTLVSITGMASAFLTPDPTEQVTRQATRSLQPNPAVASATIHVFETEEGIDLSAAVVVRKSDELTRVVDHVTDDLLPQLEDELGAPIASQRLDFVIATARLPFSRQDSAPTVLTVS